MTPLTAFLIGITTGGLTCLAVQGGLLFGLLARQQKESEAPTWQRLLLPVGAFLVMKFIAYTLLGFGLGWLGSKLQLSTTVRIWMQAIAAAVMIISGVKIIWPNVMPWFTLQPPASFRRLVRRNAKSEALIAPAILGFLTILIPCGTTQALEVSSIATANPITAALIMGAFVLGTAPLFFIIGVLAKGAALTTSKLRYVAGLLVVGVGLYSWNGVLLLMDSPYSWQNEMTSIRTLIGNTGQNEPSDAATASDEATIQVSGRGYAPNDITVAAGKPFALHLKTAGGLGCTSTFLIPALKIERNLPESGTTTIDATFSTPGNYAFTCGMGMYRGVIHAI